MAIFEYILLKLNKLIYDKSYIENLSSSPALYFTDVPIFGEDYHCNVDEQKQTSSDSKAAINVGQRSGNIQVEYVLLVYFRRNYGKF